MKDALGWLGLVSMLGLAHCAAGGDDSGSGAFGGGGFAAGDAGSGTGGSGATGGSGGGTQPPPEREVESSFRSPVATGRYVWSANPDSSRVALVDAFTLEVKVVEAGHGPTHLAALPTSDGSDAAIVLNVKSNDASVLSATANGEVNVNSAPVHQGANAWAISPSGDWAIAWTNADGVENPDPTEGFQDVSVIALAGASPESTRLSVGYRPTRIFIAEDESRAFAVTEPGISIIELEGSNAPYVSQDIPVTDNPLDNPASRDVSITPDGALALVRRDGSPDVGIVSLDDGSRVTITLSGAVTDLDLTDDSTSAIAVVRENSEVVLLPIPGILSDPNSAVSVLIEGETFGSVSVSPQGAVALLYTNAIANDHLTILRTSGSYSHRSVALKSAVLGVFPAPDAAHAIALLDPGPSSTRPGAFSVVPIAEELPPKIEGTDAPPQAVAIEPPPSRRAIVTTSDEARKIYGAYIVSMPGLQVDRLTLASPPLATGIVPQAGVAYVAQEHPEGRITFIDLTTGVGRTLTGFELAAKVVQ